METKVEDESKGKDLKRGKNFKDAEVALLLRLVSDKKDIVECKKSDYITIKEKEKVWRSIETEFNAESGIFYRDWTALRMKYDNIKKTAKKRWAEDKKYICGTGGGPFKPPKVTETDVKIKDIIGDLPVLGMPSQNDSDFQGNESFTSTSESVFTPLTFTLDEEHGIGDIEFTESGGSSLDVICQNIPKEVDTNNKSKIESKVSSVSLAEISSGVGSEGFGKDFSAKLLKGKTSQPLYINKTRRTIMDRSKVGAKVEEIAKAKEELLKLQKKLYEDQILFQREEHELKMDCLRKERELLQRRLERESV